MSRSLTDKQALDLWNPEDDAFWAAKGKAIATRNLWISIFCLFLAFATWMIFSVVAVNLNSAGFNFTQAQLFTLLAMPGLSGAIMRIFCSFIVPIVGGRNWTVFSTALLLIPAIGIGMAVQNPETSYTTMLLLALSCGFGGGNFSSSMSNISFFFPKKAQGAALGLNAGLGNLGVSAVQFVVPLVIGFAAFGVLGGNAQTLVKEGVEKTVWLQNAGFVLVIPIILAVLAAAFGMNNLKCANAPLSEQLVIFKRKHMYLTTWLYIMSFGSFIGYSAAFPLLLKSQFVEVNALQLAFIGPLLGALIRPVGGIVSDKVGGAVVTLWSLILMVAAALGVVWFIQDETRNFLGFFIAFMVLFTASGIANGSVFRMIGVIFPPKEKAPVLGFSGAVAAFGAFYIPKAFGWSIEATGHADAALYGFVIYYLTCVAVLYGWYLGKRAEIKC